MSFISMFVWLKYVSMIFGMYIQAYIIRVIGLFMGNLPKYVPQWRFQIRSHSVLPGLLRN
jgi:hypothetical protein